MITITVQDPTRKEADALRAYLAELHNTTTAGDRIAVQHTERAGAVEVRQTIYETDEPQVTLSDDPTVPADVAGAPDFDSAGMPHDPRIHASSRATVADGTWRKKRGVSPESVEEIEQELRSNLVGGEDYIDGPEITNLPIVEAPEVPEAPVGEHGTSANIVTALVETFTEISAAASTDAPLPPPANPFLAVMSRIGKSKLDKAKKDELLTAAGALDDKGAPSILVLNKRPELIDGFIALLDSEGI